MILHPVTKAITQRELKSYFSTPLGYIFLVIFLFSLGYATFEPGRGSFFILKQADLSSMFQYIPWLFLFLIPAVSMRMWAEERKTGTIELLLTLPVTVSQAVTGKFLAAWTFISIGVLLTFPMILTVIYLGSPDYSVIILGYLGSILLGGTYLAVGSFFSAITKNQVISFILSVGACYLLLMAASPPILGFMDSFLPNFFIRLFENLSLMNHFEALQRGVVRLGDILFFFIMMAGWLYGCFAALNEKKAD